MSIRTRLWSILLAVSLFSSGVIAESAPESSTLAAPAFSLLDQNGGTHTLAQYKGKIVVLEWTNPDCPFVKRHYAQGAMRNFAKYFTDRGIVWLALNSRYDASPTFNQEWAKKNALHYPVLSDQDGRVGKAFDAKTTPFFTVLDMKGQIAYQGAFDDDPFADKRGTATNYVALALKALMEQKPVELARTKSYGSPVKYKS